MLWLNESMCAMAVLRRNESMGLAVLWLNESMCSGSAVAERKHVLRCAIGKVLNVVAHCQQL